MDLVFFGSLLFWALLGGITCGIAGYMMLDIVDSGWQGFFAGLFLGPIGLVIAWVMRDNLLRERAERAERAKRHAPIDDTIHRMQSLPRRGRNEASQVPPVSRPATSAIEELERLAALREKGHVTDEEFNIRKRQLLGLTEPAPPPPRRFK
jgi:predicted lipid-binding transport protein (Tim44 family)